MVLTFFVFLPIDDVGDDDDVWLVLERERFQDDALRLHGQDPRRQGLQPGRNGILHGQSGVFKIVQYLSAAQPLKITFSVIVCNAGFEHCDWLKNLEQPIKIPKNNIA